MNQNTLTQIWTSRELPPSEKLERLREAKEELEETLKEGFELRRNVRGYIAALEGFIERREYDIRP